MKKYELTKEALASATPEEKLKHGRRAHASWMCKKGMYTEARAYCAQHGIEYPPFSDFNLGTAPSKLPEDSHGAAGDPPTEVQRDSSHETAPLASDSPAHQESPKERKAYVVGSCLNKRLLRVRLEGSEEIVSMWKSRNNYGKHDEVTVVLSGDSTPGNPIYEEVWRPT